MPYELASAFFIGAGLMAAIVAYGSYRIAESRAAIVGYQAVKFAPVCLYCAIAILGIGRIIPSSFAATLVFCSGVAGIAAMRAAQARNRSIRLREYERIAELLSRPRKQ